MMNAIEKMAYLPHLPSVKAGSTGRSVIDYAVCCAIANVICRDVLLFPEGRHGTFTKEELTKTVCAEVQPFDDYCNDQVESDYVDASINGLINSGFLQEDYNGNLTCSYISGFMVDLWKNQRPKLIDESEDEETVDAEEIPELF